MSSVRILIADDHALVRRGLRALLEAQPGWEVCAEAANGREAVKKAKQLGPNIVIMDITMPDLNGLEATRQIVKVAPKTEVLILTMHESEEIVKDVFAMGGRGYVLKSDAERDLVSAVDALSRHKPFFTSTASQMMLDSYLEGPGRPPKKETACCRLTPRERETLQLLTEGKTNKEVAVGLSISVRTVESHRANLMRKLGCQSFSELVHYAIRNNIACP